MSRAFLPQEEKVHEDRYAVFPPSGITVLKA